MKPIVAASALLILLGSPVSADPWKDESGHSGWWREDQDFYEGRGRDYRREYRDSDGARDRHYRREHRRGDAYRRDYRRQYAYGREYKEEFWYDGCKIERKWERNGDYKEERKCERD
jgi:hypothetical protein